MAATLEMVEEAEIELLSESKIDAEDKAALIESIGRVKAMLAPENSGQAISNIFQNSLPGTASQFSLVSSLMGSDADAISEPPALRDVLNEIAEVRDYIKESVVDEPSRKVIDESLAALEIFLRHVEIIGFDAAYSAYVNLLTRLRRQQARYSRSQDGGKSEEALQGLWPKIRGWAEKLQDIEKALTSGKKLLEYGQAIGGLFGVEVPGSSDTA